MKAGGVQGQCVYRSWPTNGVHKLFLCAVVPDGCLPQVSLSFQICLSNRQAFIYLSLLTIECLPCSGLWGYRAGLDITPGGRELSFYVGLGGWGLDPLVVAISRCDGRGDRNMSVL